LEAWIPKNSPPDYEYFARFLVLMLKARDVNAFLHGYLLQLRRRRAPRFATQGCWRLQFPLRALRADFRGSNYSCSCNRDAKQICQSCLLVVYQRFPSEYVMRPARIDRTADLGSRSERVTCCRRGVKVSIVAGQLALRAVDPDSDGTRGTAENVIGIVEGSSIPIARHLLDEEDLVIPLLKLRAAPVG
jgi:hypothetical protein